MTIRVTNDDDEPDLDIEGLDSADTEDTPEDEDALEQETATLRLLLGIAVSGHTTRAVMTALSLTLQAVVAEVARDMTAIEAFGTLFQGALRDRWLRRHDVDKGD